MGLLSVKRERRRELPIKIGSTLFKTVVLRLLLPLFQVAKGIKLRNARIAAVKGISREIVLQIMLTE